MKKKPTPTPTNTKSESKGKSKMVPSTTNSKAATQSPGVKKSKRETEEEYQASHRAFLKRLEEDEIRSAANYRLCKAMEEKHGIQEFKNRCASLDYCFSPSEGRLIDYYLRNKNSDKEIAYSPIEEVDVYANHPQTLTENYLRNPGKVGYFFTCSRPNETHSCTNVQSHWIFGEMEDVLNEGEKVGVKQVIQYGEGDQSSGYKIIEYRLDPAPVDRKAWFICKFCDDESCLVPNQA